MDRFAREFLTFLARGDIESALSRLDRHDSVRTVDSVRADFGAVLALARDSFRLLETDSASLVGWNVVHSQVIRGELTYELKAGTRWMLITVGMTGDTLHLRISSFMWLYSSQSLAEHNRFSLASRSVGQYAYLLLAVLAAVTSLTGAIVAYRYRLGWRWIVLALLGVTKASIDWTTGDQSFNWFSLQVLGAGIARGGPVAPWIVSFSLPAGAIAVLLRLPQLRATIKAVDQR